MTPEQQANPLINPPQLPNGALPFDQVKTEHYLPALEWALERARADYAAIRDNSAFPTFENTIVAAEYAGKDLDRVLSVFSNTASLISDDEIRALEKIFSQERTKFANEISMDDVMFQRIKAIYDGRHTLSLDRDQQLLLEKSYKGRVRSGALLDDSGKERLKEINERLAALSTQFRNNTTLWMKDYKKVIDNESDLDGVPQRVKDRYAAAAEKEGMPGKWLVKLLPHPEEILNHDTNRALREEIFKAAGSISWGGPYDNSSLIMEIVRLRHEKAHMLGAPDHAAFVLEQRMARTAETVNNFLEKNQRIYKPQAEIHLDKVRELARQDGVTDMQPWDFPFYARALEERECGVSEEELRPYFEFENVIKGLHEHVEKLFGIKMNPADNKYPVWHPDVKVYEVEDKKSGELIGVFYTDYFARPGIKRDEAWEDAIVSANFENGKRTLPFVINCCNYSRPEPGQPLLLSQREVTTLFHEQGHGLHDLMARGRYGSQMGTKVKWDFVELPSQVQENWAKEPEVMRGFAKHYQTGEVIPDSLIEKVNALEKLNAAPQGLRQTFLGKLDMAWHTTDPATITSVEALEDKVLAEVMLFPRTAGPMSTRFSHLFAGGYDAGYYGYKWAEVLDADVFAEFSKNGLYDETTADRLAEIIYKRGGTEEPDILYRILMGRDPDPDALFRREGLLPPAGDSGNSPSAPLPNGPTPA